MSACPSQPNNMLTAGCNLFAAASAAASQLTAVQLDEYNQLKKDSEAASVSHRQHKA